jgi:hypothetical protein
LEKPTIFFSHSSKDKLFISELRRIISEKTSGTIEIFQSSDGESIPFGRNWVHKIEQNLNDAKIMFVFISPNSIKSNWIYFESGFSYSKDIRVIPIGILGLDIGKLSPPMSLLQGFNLHNYEGINNIISILNSEFSCNYKTDFSEIEGEKLNRTTSFYNSIEDDIIDKIDYIETDIISILQDNPLNGNPIEIFNAYLSNLGIKKVVNASTNQIFLSGMEVNVKQNPQSKMDEFNIKIDLLTLTENINIVSGLLPLIYTKPLAKYWMYIYFNESIELLTTNYKISARLNKNGVEMSEHNGRMYEYGNLLFALDDIDQNRTPKKLRQDLRIVFKPGNFDIIELFNLIKLLFSIGIIRKREDF